MMCSPLFVKIEEVSIQMYMHSTWNEDFLYVLYSLRWFVVVDPLLIDEASGIVLL